VKTLKGSYLLSSNYKIVKPSHKLTNIQTILIVKKLIPIIKVLDPDIVDLKGNIIRREFLGIRIN
jgi:hypothetical protein